MRITLFLLSALFYLPLHAQLKNELLDNPSPYLAMHGHDPVHWQTWGEAAFAVARKENKLIYVSDGYFACHWCHVMQRESYQNPEIAKLINQNFIPIKVDRELHPALDAYLVNFLENSQGYSGWPLNVFITPEGHPLVGLVYLPPKDFHNLLNKVATLWRQDSRGLKQDAADAAREMAAQAKQTTPHVADRHDVQNYVRSLMTQMWQLADEMQGGFGEQSKFPMVPQMQTLLDMFHHSREQRLGQFLRLTLDQMASQGLHDHIGGGFFRYSVDQGWQVPHFEKMLYDNAQLSKLYLDAADVFGEPRYKHIGLETLDFMLRELQDPRGGFISSLSAVDRNNIEGGYYLWQSEQLKSVLNSEEYRVASQVWKLHGTPSLDAGYLPVESESIHDAAKTLGMSVDKLSELLESARKKLFSARSKRSLPRDTKRLAAWNGLALSALAKAITISDEPRYRQAGEQTADYLSNTLWDGDKLWRARAGGQGLGQAGVEDYAMVAQGLKDWQNSRSGKHDMSLLLNLQAQAWKRFFNGSWTRSEQHLLQYGNRDALLSDDVLPSPSATLIRLGLNSGDKKLNRQARQALALSHEVLQNQPFWYVGTLHVLEAQHGVYGP